MGRPAGPKDYNRRLKAFELYASGIKKSDIAQELGVTRPCIGTWAKNDRWDERIAGIVSRAEEAVNHVVGNEVADTLAKLRTQMAQRVRELEQLCQPSNKPTTRLQAIKYWLELAGIRRAMPNPADPTTPKSLELFNDLLEKEDKTNADVDLRSDSVSDRDGRGRSNPDPGTDRDGTTLQISEAGGDDPVS